MRDAYPTGPEVVTFLSECEGIAVPESIDPERTTQAAVSEWEALTDCRPFLVSAGGEVSGTIRSYDPPGPRTSRATRGGGRRLMLGMGLVRLDGLSVGVQGESAGTELTLGTDFWLGPENADAERRPWTIVEFAGAQRGLPRSVRVEGVWGFWTALEDEVWEGIRDIAAGRVLQTIRERMGLDEVEIKDGDKAVRYSIERIGTLGDSLIRRGKAVAPRYRLMG